MNDGRSHSQISETVQRLMNVRLVSCVGVWVVGLFKCGPTISSYRLGINVSELPGGKNMLVVSWVWTPLHHSWEKIIWTCDGKHQNSVMICSLFFDCKPRCIVLEKMIIRTSDRTTSEFRKGNSGLWKHITPWSKHVIPRLLDPCQFLQCNHHVRYGKFENVFRYLQFPSTLGQKQRDLLDRVVSMRYYLSCLLHVSLTFPSKMAGNTKSYYACSFVLS